MEQLKLNEVGIIHDKLVKCIKYNYDKGHDCNKCAFRTTPECSQLSCNHFDHSSGEDVLFILVNQEQ